MRLTTIPRGTFGFQFANATLVQAELRSIVHMHGNALRKQDEYTYTTQDSVAQQCNGCTLIHTQLPKLQTGSKHTSQIFTAYSLANIQRRCCITRSA